MPHNYPIATIQYRTQLPQYSLNPRRAIIDPEIIGHKLFRQSQTIWKCFKIITLKHGIEAFQYYRQQFSKNILSGLPCRHGVFGVQRDCVMRTKIARAGCYFRTRTLFSAKLMSRGYQAQLLDNPWYLASITQPLLFDILKKSRGPKNPSKLKRKHHN